MPITNNMTRLVNKIERRLGTAMLNLPENLSKSKWADIIKEDTLTTFSRYFPNKILYEVNVDTDRKGEYCIIREDKLPPDVEILGIRDINWEQFTESSAIAINQPYGIYDFFAGTYGLEDIAMAQMMANQTSLFDYGIYPEFVEPNKIKLCSITGGDVMRSIRKFKIDLLIKHSDNLNTISPTKMEIFENLATADVAMFLYGSLKYFDNLETVFGNIDIKLDELQSWAQKRDEYVGYLEDTHVSAGNDNQPMMFTI